ncbi:MAG: S49 family peptidase [Chlamydiae bacterium]|nr:S49 family peptidase [Chlamydiota bacterium]
MPPRESLFLSTFRSLCRALGIVFGIFLAFFIITIILSSLSQKEQLPEKGELTVAPDAEGQRKLLSSHVPVILRLDVRGVIGLENLTAEKFQNLLYDTLEPPLQGRVKAIFLYVDTPGGSAMDSASIYQALFNYKKKHEIPIYAFVEGLCASGGMYICSAADRILATDASVIGSVGVILGPNFNVSTLMDKIGVQSLTITQGKDKDALNPFRPWKPGEDGSLVSITQELYEQFVSVVSLGRPLLNKEKLINEYGAHVFLATRAKDLGYIDEAGATYESALQGLVESLQLQDQEYQVFSLSPSENFFSQLAQNKSNLLSGKIEHTVHFHALPQLELKDPFLYLYQP